MKRKAVAAMALCMGLSPVQAAASVPAGASLKEKYPQIRARLERNPFGRPLALDSAESDGELRGDAYAVLSHPFAKLREGLAAAASWCEILTLPFNVQKCEANGEALTVFIGRRPESPVEQATRIRFTYSLVQRGEDLLQVRLAAPTGPAGTRDYRINFLAIPLGPNRSLVQLSYGYAQGTMSRIAMQTYLSTSGAGKVGFTEEGVGDDGEPRLVGGLRGVIERNTMRYFLAIEAFLDALDAPPADRRRVQLEKWFDAAERHPRQLREMAKDRYLALKSGAARPRPDT